MKPRLLILILVLPLALQGCFVSKAKKTVITSYSIHYTKLYDFKRPRNILRLLGRTFFGRENRRPPHPLPVRHPRPEELQAPGELGVTWLGHSTVLLEIEGHLV